MSLHRAIPANRKTVIYKGNPVNLHGPYPALMLFLVACLLVLSAPGIQAETDKEAAADTWIGAPIVGASPCEALAQRVCGEHNECAGQEGCSRVQQFLKSEQAERGASENPNRMTRSSGRCQEADRDRKLFTSCNLQHRPGQQ